MRVLKVVLGCLICFMLFPFFLSSVKDARSDLYTQTVPNVVTTNSTSADIVLLNPIFDDEITNVSSVVSNNIADSPAVDVYVPETKTLTCEGLNLTDTRTLYITYKYARTGMFQGIDTFLWIAPLLIILAVIFVIVMHAWGARG